ncbi:UNKNOWN [Stylonychia lemnae]|uniref:Cyclin N-terminal domain-containing protein n=1 Tax=Stylonychia lemnae TaxID=5949 RepID=A0A078AQR0_STYLE|nr:UNKNOWN [Stylonychia lemnae]|eukprot:CDW83238.1 UNKNOWN [Stylonychia lemnae]
MQQVQINAVDSFSRQRLINNLKKYKKQQKGLKKEEQISSFKKSSQLSKVYKEFGLKERNRARMIDWMYQVFKILNKSSDQTFFLSISIMDKFFKKAYQQKSQNDPEQQYDLHLALEYKINETNMFQESMIILKQLFHHYQQFKLAQDDIEYLKLSNLNKNYIFTIPQIKSQKCRQRSADNS